MWTWRLMYLMLSSSPLEQLENGDVLRKGAPLLSFTMFLCRNIPLPWRPWVICKVKLQADVYGRVTCCYWSFCKHPRCGKESGQEISKDKVVARRQAVSPWTNLCASYSDSLGLVTLCNILSVVIKHFSFPTWHPLRHLKILWIYL